MPRGRSYNVILVKFSVLGAIPPSLTDGVKFRVKESTKGRLLHTKFQPIGATCQPCGAKPITIALFPPPPSFPLLLLSPLPVPPLTPLLPLPFLLHHFSFLLPSFRYFPSLNFPISHPSICLPPFPFLQQQWEYMHAVGIAANQLCCIVRSLGQYCHHAIFPGNRSNLCRDIAIYWRSIWHSPPWWIFKNSKFQWPVGLRGQCASSYQILWWSIQPYL